MDEERRNGLLELERKLDAHIDDFDKFKSDLLTVIAGPEDPLTGDRSGGMRGAIIAVANGGTQVRYSRRQKTAIWTTVISTVGTLGTVIVLLLIEVQKAT